MIGIPVQFVIYAYLYMILALFVFDLAFLLQKQRLPQRRKKREKKLKGMMADLSTEQNRLRLANQLTRAKWLLAFVNVLEQCTPQQQQEFRQVFQKNLSGLADNYRNHPQSERTLYVWFLAHFSLIQPEHTKLLTKLLTYMDHPSTYCRENTMKAIITAGNPQVIVNMIEQCNNLDAFIYPKIISDNLLYYPNDSLSLAHQLWQHFPHLQQNIQIAIIQYLTRIPETSSQLQEQLSIHLIQADTPLEVKLAIMRYFARFPYLPIQDYLIQCLRQTSQIELAIVSAKALASYPYEQVIEALKQSITSFNWNVRYNSAASLAAISDETDLLDELSDPYARQILEYHLEKKREVM